MVSIRALSLLQWHPKPSKRRIHYSRLLNPDLSQRDEHTDRDVLFCDNNGGKKKNPKKNPTHRQENTLQILSPRFWICMDCFCRKSTRGLISCFLLFVSETESEEVYKRQVLSITCIAMGISFLGTLCMALYCRNKWVWRRIHKRPALCLKARALKEKGVWTARKIMIRRKGRARDKKNKIKKELGAAGWLRFHTKAGLLFTSWHVRQINYTGALHAR